MFRTALVAALVLAAGCTHETDPVADLDLHREVTCSSAWSTWLDVGAKGCEAACVAPPPGYVLDYSAEFTCSAMFPGPVGPETALCREGQIFEIDGIRGCCFVDGMLHVPTAVQFAVCVD